MKTAKILSLLLVISMLLSLFAGLVGASGDIVTSPTGYTKASDVDYKTYDGYLTNWGARGEDCTFLSKYAEAFYTGSNTYASLSQKKGGTSQSNASSSALYSALKGLMSSKHSHQTSYGETRYIYRNTDCLKNDANHISSFYSGATLNGAWGSSPQWNREHTWPDSKGLEGNDENDIMMLRPTAISENSSRGNTAYGESSKYFDPGEAVRGDCARIVLYVYTRWGNTKYMWGEGGVMENMNVLLKWMEEDPVDTWEMGRNDAVQDITGTRNVYVDYPEFAWLLFGQSIPSGMSTPSGEAGGVVACTHPATREERVEPTCIANGSVTTFCTSCGRELSTQTLEALGHNYVNGTCSRCGLTEGELPNDAFVLSNNIKAGDEIVIVCKAKNIAFSGEKLDGTSFYNEGIAVTPANGMLIDPPAATIWTVGEKDGGYTFSYYGQKVSMADDYSSTPYGEKHDVWALETAKTAGAVYIKNVGRDVYLEWFEDRNYWSGYYNSSNEDLFAMNIYIKGADPEEAPTTPGEEPTTPSENPTTPSEEPTTPSEEPTTPSEEPTEPEEEELVEYKGFRDVDEVGS